MALSHWSIHKFELKIIIIQKITVKTSGLVNAKHLITYSWSWRHSDSTVLHTIFWLSLTIESCNWFDFISVAYASWYNWNCIRTQRKAATINQLACPSYNLYVQLLWFPMYSPWGMKARVSPGQWSKPHSILALTQDSNPGGWIQSHKRWPLHYHCTLWNMWNVNNVFNKSLEWEWSPSFKQVLTHFSDHVHCWRHGRNTWFAEWIARIHEDADLASSNGNSQ